MTKKQKENGTKDKAKAAIKLTDTEKYKRNKAFVNAIYKRLRLKRNKSKY